MHRNLGLFIPMSLKQGMAGLAKHTLSKRQKYIHMTHSPSITPGNPRHLLTIADLSAPELICLIQNASKTKRYMKSLKKTPSHLGASLAGKTVAMMFSKRSTRTRVSSEAAITILGGQPMFLGSSDIQLGVNESLYDTSKVISSMTAAILARVADHSEVAELARWSSVPVINALSNNFHPLQAIADFQTINESVTDLHKDGFHNLKIAWIGDSSNVLCDLAIAAMKLGVNLSIASPSGYTIPPSIKKLINSANQTGADFHETHVPEEAIKGADVLLTDTWISMGQEKEAAGRKQAFSGFQITEALAQKGGAKQGWKFMHCLPRHSEEVDDGVFYGNRSLVFPEAENRLWSAVSVLEGFVINRGVII